MTGIKTELIAFSLALCVTLQACQRPTHPSELKCQSTEEAAKSYYKMISNSDANNVSFEYDKYADGLSGFKIYGPDRKPIGSIVVQNSDCSLKFFSDLVLE